MKRLGLIALGVAVFAASAALAADVPQVYTQKCELCHSIGGQGGKKKDVGGPLDGVGKKRDEAWLRAYIADPKSQMPDAKMPKIKMTEQQFNDIVAYMMSLK